MALSEDEQILGNLIHEVSSLQAKLENMKGTLAYRLRDEEEAKLRLETTQATVNSFRLDIEKYQLAYEEAKLNLENYILKQHALKLAQAELEQDPDFNSRAKEEAEEPPHAKKGRKRR